MVLLKPQISNTATVDELNKQYVKLSNDRNISMNQSQMNQPLICHSVLFITKRKRKIRRLFFHHPLPRTGRFPVYFSHE